MNLFFRFYHLCSPYTVNYRRPGPCESYLLLDSQGLKQQIKKKKTTKIKSHSLNHYYSVYSV